MPRYSPSELNAIGDACFNESLENVTRRFKNRLKSIWIFEPLIGGLAPVWGATVRRFQPDLSNSKFKHRYVKRGGDIRLLKTLPRIKCQPLVGMRDLSRPWRLLPVGAEYHCGTGVWDPVKRVREKKKRKSLRAKPGVNGPGQSATKPVADRAVPWKARSLFSNPSIRPTAWVQDGTMRVVGGITTSFPPAEGHKKYWYFLRRRGVWAPSHHHPYKDDAKVYHFKVDDSVD
jgi:hypothetical protein